jgi:hypothetical protein
VTRPFSDEEFQRGYHAVLDPAADKLAETITTLHIDRLGVYPFDESVTEVVRAHGGGLSVEQVAAAIIHARELCTEHGIMTFWTSSGAPMLVPGGGNDQTRAHDTRMATALVTELENAP